MPDLQGGYSELQPIGAVGRRASSEEWNTITRLADGAIGFGQPVTRSGDQTSALLAAGTLSAAATAQAGNTGNGAMGAITVSAGTPVGDWRLVITAASANAGTFQLFNPSGQLSGQGTVGSAYNKNGMAFTLADGATDFAVNDAFTLRVSSTAGLFLGITEADIGLTRSTTVDEYAQYDNMPVMLYGTMWVTAGATVTAGQRVYWNSSTKRYTATETDILIPNAEFASAAVDGGLVKVRLLRVPAAVARN